MKISYRSQGWDTFLQQSANLGFKLWMSMRFQLHPPSGFPNAKRRLRSEIRTAAALTNDGTS